MTLKQNRPVAAGYIRVSTEDQTEFSPEAQRKALARYAQANGLDLNPQYLFVDEGISGRQAARRPGFMAMIAAAKQKPAPFQVILVHKFDRFARSREDSVVYKAMLRRECGVRVVSITESIEDDRFSVILEAMLEAMAEYYSINLSEEVKKGMTEKALRGQLQAAPAFGYRVQNGELLPVPEEAAVVRELFARCQAGQGCYTLARWLNETGVRTRRGRLWESRGVEYLLRNPVYMGCLRWNPGGKTHRAYSTPGLIVAPGSHQALVDPGQFAAVQALLDAKKRRTRPRARPETELRHWLSGLVRCAACGATLSFVAPHYFKCSGYLKGRCRTSQHIAATALEQAVLERLRLDTAASPGLRALPITTAAEPDTVMALNRQQAQIQKRLDRLREAFLAGADTLAEYQTEKAALLTRQQALSQRLAQLEDNSKENRNGVDSAAAQRIGQVLADLDAPGLGITEKHRAALAVLDRCVWDKAAWRLQLFYRTIV